MNGTQNVAKATRYRYVIFLTVIVLALINYIDRGAISYASSQIIGEYGFDRAAWGQMMGYFGYGYMFGALVGGALADRFGSRRLWIIAGIAWSVFAMAMTIAGDLGIAIFGGSALAGFAVVRVLFGFAEGPAYSVINKTMSLWAPRSERGFAVSLGLLSTPLGAMLTAPVAVGLLLLADSWRLMYIILGATGLVLIALFALIYTNRPNENPNVNAAELDIIQEGRKQELPASTAKIDFRGFFSNRTLVFNAIGYFSFMYVNFMLLTWTPKYLQDQFGFTLSSLWYVGMIPWTGACITILVGGKLSDWILRRTGNLRLARGGFAAGSLLLTTITFLFVANASTPWAVIALMTLANAFNSLPNSVFWAVIIDTAPERTGTNSGITHFIANIATVLSPTLAGILSSTYGYPAMFLGTAAAAAIGVCAMLMVKPSAASPKPAAARFA